MNHSVEFTGKERDAETGLDYFGARYFSGAQGRFTSVDPILGTGVVDNPQSWNRYAHVHNNPLRKVDPDGNQSLDVSNPSVQRLLQALKAVPGNKLGTFKGGLLQTAADFGIRTLLGELFGYSPRAYRGGLETDEYSILNKASAHERGALMVGVGRRNEPGIDAVDLDNVKGISLKKAANVDRVKDAAKKALDSARRAGLQDVHLYVDATSITRGEATGLSKLQEVLGSGVITKVVIFTSNGAVEYVPISEQQERAKCIEQNGDSKCP